MQVLTDREAMLWALQEAKKGRGWVSPNPVVGCCMLDANNRLLSVGAHLKFGEKHAEANALDKIVDKTLLSGAKVFVTLEPCAHVGSQPSCAHTLANYSLGKVVYLVEDPNPLAEGGASVLRQAGIRVEKMTELEDQGRVLAEVFLMNQKLKRTHFHLKVASSLDGQIANASGASQWITGEEAREKVQVMRGQCDGVLIGRSTFEQDAPRLNSRGSAYAGKSNWAVVLDPSGQLRGRLANSSLASVREVEKIIWVTQSGIEALEVEPVTHLAIDLNEAGSLDLKELGAKLLDLGVCSVLVEGGARTFSSFFRQGVCDRLSLFQSPSLIGAMNSPSWSSHFETHDLSTRPFLHQVETAKVGEDLFVSGRVTQV